MSRTPLHGLPPIIEPRDTWHLPLADGTAAAILAALLSGTAERSRDRFERILATDPALLLWTVGQAQVVDRQRIVTVGQGAVWLEKRRLLLADDAPPRLTTWHRADADEDRLRAARLAAAGVLTGELYRADRRTVCDDVDAGLFVALLSHAGQWLELAAAQRAERIGVPTWLPEPLRPLVACREGSPSAGPASVEDLLSKRARADRAVASMLPAGCRTAPPADAAPSSVHSVLRAWLETDGAAIEQLGALLEKLHALGRWEVAFERRLETEKLDAMKELAYGASHEINNPLANIALRAQTLLKEEDDPQRRRKLLAIHRQAMRAHEMISDLMLFARPPELDRQPVDLVALIDRLVEELAERAEADGAAIVHERADAPVTVLADPVQLSIAVRALCENSLEATGPEGRVWLAAQRIVSGRAAGGGRLTVRDNGPGIPETVRRHLFDPFFSGREAGRGLGFGLSKCWRIVTRHGGRIDVEQPPGAGARFVIVLPGGGEAGP